jgi:flagellar hook-associated protein 3 FlgL
MQMRVATFAINDQMIASALRTQSTMANQQIQEASGLISSDFGGLGSSAQQVLNLQVSVTRAQSYIDAATQTNSKIQVMYSAVNSVSDLVTQFRTSADGCIERFEHGCGQRHGERQEHAGADGVTTQHAI